MKPLRRPIGAVLCLSLAASAARAQRPETPTPRPQPVALPVEQAVLLEGKPFPPVPARSFRPAEPKRTFFVVPGSGPGDGTEASPWHDLQAALSRLTPGDRLRVRGGAYKSGIAIGPGCTDGLERDPIQVIFDGKASL